MGAVLDAVSTRKDRLGLLLSQKPERSDAIANELRNLLALTDKVMQDDFDGALDELDARKDELMEIHAYLVEMEEAKMHDGTATAKLATDVQAALDDPADKEAFKKLSKEDQKKFTDKGVKLYGEAKAAADAYTASKKLIDDKKAELEKAGSETVDDDLEKFAVEKKICEDADKCTAYGTAGESLVPLVPKLEKILEEFGVSKDDIKAAEKKAAGGGSTGLIVGAVIGVVLLGGLGFYCYKKN